MLYGNREKALLLSICLLFLPSLAENVVTKDTCRSSGVSSLKNIRCGPGVFGLSGSARLHGEYFSNRSLKVYGSETDDNLLLTRLAVGAYYRLDFGLSLHGAVYDARMFFNAFTPDDFTPSCPHENRLDWYYGYADYRSTGPIAFGIRAGRQQFSFADQRIWGKGVWSNSTKYRWDGVLGNVTVNSSTLHLLWGRLLQVDPGRFDKHYQDFDAFGCYVSTGLVEKGAADGFWVGKFTTAATGGTGSSAVNTIGAHIQWPSGAFLLNGTGAWQFGTTGAEKIIAGGAALSGRYTLQVPLKPSLSLGYTVASGDSDPLDGTCNTFDGVFGSTAKYYGRLNLFYWSNLHDMEFGTSLALCKKTEISFMYHYFMLASPTDAWYGTNAKPHKRSDGKARRDQTGNSGRELGHEIDLVVVSSLLPFTKIEAGLGRLFPGDFIRATASTPGEKRPVSTVFVQAEVVY
ncbi:MAG: alginate export family protein [Chitinispirillaceae bacterium]|nr:alginate export family protein [Chitinispirillaceae bacterium]